jgi:hypothetical protein
VTRFVLVFLAIALAGLVAWYNATNLEEAFGHGPPYYGRTTNMDKWHDPRPLLVAVDMVAGAVIIALAMRARRCPSQGNAEYP